MLCYRAEGAILNPIFRNYLETVTLSEAKGLVGQNKRFLAALGMTFCVLSLGCLWQGLA